jgi:hypothetical protein
MAGPVHAAWEKVGETEVGDVFFDRSSVKRNGTNLRVLTLVSATHKPVNTRESGPMSYMREVEIACKNHQVKVVSGTVYTGTMANGGVFKREDAGRWSDVPSGTPIAKVVDLVCVLSPVKP